MTALFSLAIRILAISIIINFIHRKNFDSSINKEEEKIQKKKDTHSQHTETGIQTTQVIAW